MKQIYTLLTAAVVLGMSSCSSSKQTTQSSPDMYSNGSSRSSGSASGDYYAATPNDQYVQMKASDPDRWSYFDDYDGYDSYYAPSPAAYGGYGMGYPYPSYGFGYGYGFGPSFGLGFGDPYMMWNSYFIWNSWYNPYFYNPYYGGGVLLVGKGGTAGTSVYSNLRPFGVTSAASGLAHYGTTSTGRNAVYRPGMVSTTAYNKSVARTSTYRPVGGTQNNNNGFRSFQSTRGFSSPSYNSGGFRGGSGGFGGRH